MSTDLPLSVRRIGNKPACDNVYGIAKQFYLSVAKFAKSQELDVYSSWRDLAGGGQMFAQYGPAGRQLLEIYMPEGGEAPEGEPETKRDVDTPPTHLRKHCDCKNVVISVGNPDYDALTDLTGKSGRTYKAIEGDYPKDYKVNVHCVPTSKGDDSHTYVAGQCRLYQDAGPTWSRRAMFFAVCDDEKDENEGRYLPVKIPSRCKQCYYWELENDLSDCDGTIYEGQDVPCGMDVSALGEDEYKYRKEIQDSKNPKGWRGVGEEGMDEDSAWVVTRGVDQSVNIFQEVGAVYKDSVETPLDPKDKEGLERRAYYDLECLEKKGHADGTFCWYVPPLCTPFTRCKTEQTLRLKCARDDKTIQEVPITIIYNRPTFKFYMDAQRDDLSYDYQYDFSDTTIDDVIWLQVCKENGGGCTCKVDDWGKAEGTVTRYNKRGYIYAVDDEGSVAYLAMRPNKINQTEIYCHGRPFGTNFVQYINSALYWSDTQYFTHSGYLDTHYHKWDQKGTIDWKRNLKKLYTEDEYYVPCYYNGFSEDAIRQKKIFYDSWWPWNGGLYGPGTVFECGDAYEDGTFSSQTYFYIACFEGSENILAETIDEQRLTEEGVKSNGTMTVHGLYTYNAWWRGQQTTAISTPRSNVISYTTGDSVFLGYLCSMSPQLWTGSGNANQGVQVDASIMGLSVAGSLDALLTKGKSWYADDTADHVPCE